MDLRSLQLYWTLNGIVWRALNFKSTVFYQLEIGMAATPFPFSNQNRESGFGMCLVRGQHFQTRIGNAAINEPKRNARPGVSARLA